MIYSILGKYWNTRNVLLGGYFTLQGDEPLPVLAVGSERGTGFTREKAKPMYVNRVMGDVSLYCMYSIFEKICLSHYFQR